MKKSALISVLFCVGVLAGTFVFAEEQDEAQPQERRGEEMRMDGEGMSSGRHMGMKGDHKGMGMKGMHGPSSMVALADGSIVVLSGNKLVKYDSDLTLIKEVEIKSEAGSRPMDPEEKWKKPEEPAADTAGNTLEPEPKQ